MLLGLVLGLFLTACGVSDTQIATAIAETQIAAPVITNSTIPVPPTVAVTPTPLPPTPTPIPRPYVIAFESNYASANLLQIALKEYFESHSKAMFPT